MAAMWIKQQSGGRTKVVIVGRPRRMLRDFDLVLATPQYRLPSRPNVLRLDLPLMRVDPAKVAAGAAAWRQRLSGLARPLTAVLVGGPTKPFVFDAAVARDFLRSLRRTTGGSGGLFVTTSRRTPPDVVEALAADLPPGGEIFRWRADAPDNPYHGLLGLADRFVVTGDSVSMLVEVARLGKPLAIFPLPVSSGLWPRLRKRLADVFQPGAGDGRGGLLTTLGNAAYDTGLIGYSREFEAVHDRLVEGGFAVILGQPFGQPRRRRTGRCRPRSSKGSGRCSTSSEQALSPLPHSAKSENDPVAQNGRRALKPTVFIQTNHKQIVGALVAEYSLKRNSQHADEFDVRIMHTKDFPFLSEREGQEYLRDGVTRRWHMEDLQSFTPTRFLPPQLMGYQGRAVAIDPDVFAVGDVWELLSRDMQGAAIMCSAALRLQGEEGRDGDQRHAARLRQAHPLEGRGAVRRAVRDEARLRQVDRPAV